MLTLSAHAEKVYVSDTRTGAKKVFVTDSRSEADMFVFFVDDQNQATEPYLWFKVDDRNEKQKQNTIPDE